MHEAVQGCPAELVFNLDEVGISDWEDRKPKKVVVPTKVSAHDIHHRLSASVACLTRYVVTPQYSEAIHRTLKATGMQLGKNLILKHHDKPEPTDTSSDDEEVLAFGEDVAELIYEFDDE
jgi:hypothetical protein